MKPRVVRQGETVQSIVAQTGGSPDAVWSDPSNDALRALRKDPAILLPGDILHVPEQAPTFLAVSVGSKNTFKAKLPTEPLTIVVKGEEALAGEAYVVTGLGPDLQGTTDGSGTIKVDVPVRTRSFFVSFPKLGVTHKVLVGHLDPVTETSGLRQRLANMGYRSPIADIVATAGVPLDDAALAHHIRGFQMENGLEATGEADQATVAAVGDAHGV